MPDYTLDDLQRALAGPSFAKTPPSPLTQALATPGAMAANVDQDLMSAPANQTWWQNPQPTVSLAEGLLPMSERKQPWYKHVGSVLQGVVDATMVGPGALATTAEDAAGRLASKAGMIRAYHGSPHNFNAFDLSKIGTGEGSQVYGHGLYFAENPDVAQAYRNMLGGEKGKTYEVSIDAHPDDMLDWDRPFEQQPPKVKAAFAKTAREMSGEHVDDDELPDYFEAFKSLDGSLAANPSSRGKIATADALWGNGVKGIRFLDQGSRAASDNVRYWEGQLLRAKADPESWDISHVQAELDKAKAAAESAQTSNYVIFDDQLIKIIRKYGLGGLGVGLGGAAAASGLYPTEGPKNGQTPVAIMGVRG